MKQRKEIDIKRFTCALLTLIACATQHKASAQDSFNESDRTTNGESPFTIPAPVQSNPLYLSQPQFLQQNAGNQYMSPPQIGAPLSQPAQSSGNGYTLGYAPISPGSWNYSGYSPWNYSGYLPWSHSSWSPWSYGGFNGSYFGGHFGRSIAGFGNIGGVGGAIGLGLGLGLGLLPRVTSFSGPYSSIYSSSCYGPYSYSAAGRYWQFTGMGANTGGHSLLGPMSGGGFVQTAPSKASGNYYAPSTADPSASGSYYAGSGANNYSYLPKTHSTASPNQNQYYKPQKNYWGSSSPFPSDLNSTPWSK